MNSQKVFYSLLFIVNLFVIWYLVRLHSVKETMENSKEESTKDDSTDVKSEEGPIYQKFDDLKRPFVPVYDDKGKQTKVILVEFVFDENNQKDYEFWKQNRDNYVFLGITSYLEFPNPVVNKFDPYADPNHKAWKYDYKQMMDGWLYCFQNPRKYIPLQKPQLFLSESDFVEENELKPDPEVDKQYDFMYVCPISFPEQNKTCKMDWTASNKNWKFAKRCIEIMCQRYDLKGLLVGRADCKFSEKCEKNMTKTAFLEWHDFIKTYRKCKFLFVPNIHDASPRIITEAMASDVPVLLNQHILGGTKYINHQTGELFDNLNNFEVQLETILQKIAKQKYSPREELLKTYGILNSGQRLLHFIQQHFRKQAKLRPECQYVTIRFPKPNRAQ